LDPGSWAAQSAGKPVAEVRLLSLTAASQKFIGHQLLILLPDNQPAMSNQLAVHFFHDKSAPAKRTG
jgi:hypothetical protein